MSNEPCRRSCRTLPLSSFYASISFYSCFWTSHFTHGVFLTFLQHHSPYFSLPLGDQRVSEPLPTTWRLRRLIVPAQVLNTTETPAGKRSANTREEGLCSHSDVRHCSIKMTQYWISQTGQDFGTFTTPETHALYSEFTPFTRVVKGEYATDSCVMSGTCTPKYCSGLESHSLGLSGPESVEPLRARGLVESHRAYICR